MKIHHEEWNIHQMTKEVSEITSFGIVLHRGYESYRPARDVVAIP